MSDHDDGLEHGQFLWILFLSLFLIIFSVTLSLLCHQACCFCSRYCVVEWKWCNGCCCYFNRQEYVRERRHLRELRQRRRQVELATFSQIPGPIPDSFGFRELQRQSAIRDLTSLGFIVVSPSSITMNHATATTHDVNSLQMRNQLTPQQRRDILDRILSSRTYHVHELDAVQHGQQIKDTSGDGNDDIEEGNPVQEESPMQSFAFPLHEEPEDPERTCAICLDSFAEGESINDTSKCPHVFHKSCLMEWLDNHNVCPCCRCPMITDTEWRLAATSSTSASSIRIQQRGDAQGPTPSVVSTSVSTTIVPEQESEVINEQPVEFENTINEENNEAEANVPVQHDGPTDNGAQSFLSEPVASS